tara:strand:+ start:89 stop:301 length:213 start_codon:yes stop_codon:yes gene_type:complete
MPAIEFNELEKIHPTGKYSVGVSAVYFCVVYQVNNQSLDLTFFGDQESIICRKIVEAAKFLAEQNDGEEE